MKEKLQPDSHSSLHLKCLCTLKEQLQARECGRPLVVGVLQRADRIREGLSHKEHQEQVNICSGTTHDPKGLRSCLRWETPAGCGTRCPLLLQDEARATRREAGVRASCCLLPPSSADLRGHCSALAAQLNWGEASHLSPKMSRYLALRNTFSLCQSTDLLGRRRDGVVVQRFCSELVSSKSGV